MSHPSGVCNLMQVSSGQKHTHKFACCECNAIDSNATSALVAAKLILQNILQGYNYI